MLPWEAGRTGGRATPSRAGWKEATPRAYPSPAMGVWLSVHPKTGPSPPMLFVWDSPAGGNPVIRLIGAFGGLRCSESILLRFAEG